MRELEQAHRAALSFDAAELDRSIGRGGDPPWRAWAEAWRALLAGDLERAAALSADTEARGARDRDAALVIESAALRALAAATAGDLPAARALARRASRMARTEAIPEQEYTAHLVLARVRRLTGQPHLATRILTALVRVAPASWQPWIAWELMMAGAPEAAPALCGEGPLHRAAAALAAVHEAARGGDPGALAAAAAALASMGGLPVVGPEAESTGAAIDGCRTPGDPLVASWCKGRTAEGPPFLHGLLTVAGTAPADESAIAYVLARPGGPRRRLPRLGWALARGDDVIALPQGRRKQGRVESLVSALLLAGEDGVEEETVFADVYGFAYEPEIHKNILHVLVHRAREWIGDAGAIDVDRGRVHLALLAPLLVPDPRCTKPMMDRLLRAVAQHQGATAKEIALAIGVSLRVAQQALAELSADGACLARRDGRRLCYVVEDTTFSEPTQID